MLHNYIEKLRTLSTEELLNIDKVIVESFPNSMTLTQIKAGFLNVPFSVYFVKKDENIVFCALILSKYPTLYLYYICVPKLVRGSGMFKKCFSYLKRLYIKKGYRYFALDASDEVGQNINQQVRLQIFSKMGFRISVKKNPSPFVKYDDMNTYLVTKKGTGRLIKFLNNRYLISINDTQFYLALDDISYSVSHIDSTESEVCPMKLSLLATKTRKINNK